MTTMAKRMASGRDRMTRSRSALPRPARSVAGVLAAVGLLLATGCTSLHDEAQAAPSVVRAPARYTDAINSFFNVTMPSAQRNGQLDIGTPELGGCPVGGRANGARGWVVPVTYTTRTGALTGKGAGITISAKQYYVWFREDTIYGVLGKPELCP